ncbi:MAG TPA: gluconate 2-dehydrogenase subunit 3 family protein, partial [Terriglobia bacterium]|nr:gluconate 2-dehydrogenase subunit 3 family protein [Terriglobia bacterium]
LAGIAGKSAVLAAEPATSNVASEAKAENLPPGLYRPSSEHLGHALVEDSRFHPIPPGCQVDFIRPRSGPFEPQFFSRDEYKVIRRLTALMLGESPAESADRTKEESIVDEVGEWIDLRTYSFAGVRDAADRLTAEQVALAEAYDGAHFLKRIKAGDPRESYRDGLAWIAQESERRFQRAFLDLSEAHQMAILDLITDARAGATVESASTRFFRQLKSDIISGFYTSTTGLKELDNKRNQFYAESPGCSPASLNPPTSKR